MKQLSELILILTLLFGLNALFGVYVRAEPLIQSVDGVLMAGFYSLEGENSSQKKVSLSGVGAYSAQCDLGFRNRFRASLGVNYLISDGFTGDTAWGFNLGVKYFPWSWNGPKIVSFDRVELNLVDRFRPFVGISLKNLQFTTVLASTYNGFGFSAGTHYTFSDEFYGAAEGQYNMLSGNSENSLTEMNFLFGVGIRLK